MAIIYYPNRVQKKVVPAIDRVLDKRRIITTSGSKDITSEGLGVVFSSDSDWQFNSLKLSFKPLPEESIGNQTFAFSVINGRSVVKDLNDSLWIQTDLTIPISITLNAGFYTGDELADELENQLNSNEELNPSESSSESKFTVSYDEVEGKYTIATTDGTNIRFLQENFGATHRYRDSIAGHLFGFTENTNFADSLESNIEVYGLNDEAWLIGEENEEITENFFDDIKILSIDQALKLEVGESSNTLVSYQLNYEKIV